MPGGLHPAIEIAVSAVSMGILFFMFCFGLVVSVRATRAMTPNDPSTGTAGAALRVDGGVDIESGKSWRQSREPRRLSSRALLSPGSVWCELLEFEIVSSPFKQGNDQSALRVRVKSFKPHTKLHKEDESDPFERVRVVLKKSKESVAVHEDVDPSKGNRPLKRSSVLVEADVIQLVVEIVGEVDIGGVVSGLINGAQAHPRRVVSAVK